MLWKDKLIEHFRDRVQFNYSLKLNSSLKTGGMSECYLDILSKEDLFKIFEIRNKSLFNLRILGRGSNTLINDGLIEGLTIKLSSTWDAYWVEEDLITFNASIYLPRAISIAHSHGLVGLEFATGIPATIGGAVKMNAGTKLGEIKEVFLKGIFIGGDGMVTFEKSDFNFSYRSSSFPDDVCLYSATFKLRRVDSKEIKAAKIKVKNYLNYRNKTQPLNKPTLGSTFINPPGDYAARLIEASGLKGYGIGGISVSTLHANFIINEGGGTAREAFELIQHIIETVKQNTGIQLQPEIKYFGFN